MNTILVATDFSAASVNAAEYAAEMALVVKKDLLLLHIYSLNVSWNQIPLTTDNTNMSEDADTALNRLRNSLHERTGHKLTIGTEVRTGVFFTELEASCDRVKPYTVVMGSQGTTAAERFLFGGHTVHAMQNLQWPLVTVPPDARFLYVRRIGLACDFNNVADITPAPAITALVKDFNAALHILNVGKETELASDIVRESEVLESLLGEVKPQYHFIAHNDTNQALMDFVENYHIHLLLVLPRERDFADKLLHKSHTRELVLKSNVPVMALHK
ncbi:Nucleotide-binding universal stress protein, UspA family [Filimonas lacunae]|uniref:Nucleotide-binding universal stress protein, UspA family n=2 Tax=Filimonas lacunae TaxID=477680 RepID=A0A173ME75_9BACT|nr:universal stress protein [Filimonas lacunae]SIT28593.1 Nucleotide-binding universal stress protein, UspA family [Filimonas lacunae]